MTWRCGVSRSFESGSFEIDKMSGLLASWRLPKVLADSMMRTSLRRNFFVNRYKDSLHESGIEAASA